MFSKTVRDGCSFPSWIKEVLIQEFIKHKDEIEPDKHREMGRKGGGGKVNQALPLQMILQFIVGYTCSTF